jgi:hypothetical protein
MLGAIGPLCFESVVRLKRRLLRLWMPFSRIKRSIRFLLTRSPRVHASCASDDPIDFRIPPNALCENRNCEDVQRAFQHWEVLEQVPEGPLITDDQNPLASLELPVAEAHFAAMRQLLAQGVWVP